MVWSFREVFLIAFIAISIVTIGTTQQLHAATEAQGCEIIDSNWEEYGERIRGANTKVSDVVLNACEAIGGRNQCTFLSGCRYNEGDANQSNSECTFNTGVSNSQHRHNNAIDLKVTEGKSKEFITFAICGLRRVNNCEGGVGYYRKVVDDNKSGAIHIDVRTGRTSIWSTGYKRVNISGNVDDPEAREILYSFGDGECVTGSISGDDSEESEYGPIEEYEPPEEYSDEFRAIIQAPDTYTPKNYFEALYQSAPNVPNISLPNFFQPIGGGTAFNSGADTDPVFSDDLIYIDSEQDDNGINDTKTSNDPFLDFITGSKNDEASSEPILSFDTSNTNAEKDNEITCEGSGFLGTNLFKTCNTAKVAGNDAVAQNDTSVVSTLVRNITKLTGSDSAEESIRTNNSQTNTLIDRTVATNNSFDGFYATHVPNDDGRLVQQNPTIRTDSNNYGQFVVGERETIPLERSPETSGNAVRFTEQSVLYGAYYGVTHTLSPLLIGSTPRSLLRLTDGNDFTRVHNLFSI